MIRIMITFVALGALAACGSAPKTGTGPGYPGWTGHQSGPAAFDGNKALYAVGIGKSRMTNLARTEACEKARVELGKFINTKINAAFQGYASSVSDGKNENAGKKAQEGMVNRVKMNLSGVGCAKMFKAMDTGEWYALAKYDAASVKGILADMKKQLASLDTLDPQKEAKINALSDKFQKEILGE